MRGGVRAAAASGREAIALTRDGSRSLVPETLTMTPVRVRRPKGTTARLPGEEDPSIPSGTLYVNRDRTGTGRAIDA